MTRPIDPGEPALAPGALVLEPKALTAAGANGGQMLPGLKDIITQRAKALLKFDPSHFGPDWFLSGKRDKSGTVPLPIFHALMLEHNKRLPSLAAMRMAILAEAEKEARVAVAGGSEPTLNILATACELYDMLYRFDPAGSGGGSKTPSEMLALMTGDRGHKDAYDPWDGWWAGDFTTKYKDSKGGISSNKDFNLHIWDRTIPLDFGEGTQFVQPVTQTVARHRWFPSPRRIEADHLIQDKCAYAVNVWRESPDGLTDGITGYVIKDIRSLATETGPGFVWNSMPHLGFLIEPDMLIWIAMEEKPGDPAGTEMAMMMFMEKGRVDDVFPGVYRIRGAEGKCKWADADRLQFKVTGEFRNPDYRFGDYRESLHLADKAALSALLALGDLKGMERSLVNEMLAALPS